MILSEQERILILGNLLDEVFGLAVNPWISESVMKTAVVRISNGRGVSVDGVKDIYSRRGRRNRKRGSPIDGFEILLMNLDTTKSEKVLIHELIDESKLKYFIFTDPDYAEIIGVLRFPRRRRS